MPSTLRKRREARRLQRHERRLVYSANRCKCGALIAYDPADRPRPTAWDCSEIILGLAIPKGFAGAVQHDDIYPFIFYGIKNVALDWALENRKCLAP